MEYLKHTQLLIKEMKQQSLFSRYYKSILTDSGQQKQNQKQKTRQQYYQTAHHDQLKTNWSREDNRINRQEFEKKDKKIKVFGINAKKQKKQDSSPFLILEEEQQEIKHQSFSSDPILLDSTQLIYNSKAEIQKIDQKMYQQNNNSQEQLQRLLENESGLINLDQDQKQEVIINVINCELNKKTIEQIYQLQNVSEVPNYSQLMASEEDKGINSIINKLQQLQTHNNEAIRKEQKDRSNLQSCIINNPSFDFLQKSKQHAQSQNINSSNQLIDVKIGKNVQRKDQIIQTSIVIDKKQGQTNLIQYLEETKQKELKLKKDNQNSSQCPIINELKSSQSIMGKQKIEKQNPNIKDYLGVQNNYQNKIANLINRYQKVSKLKQKDHQIKQQLNTYNNKQYQSLCQKNVQYQHQARIIKLKQNQQINQPCTTNEKPNMNNIQMELAQKMIIMDNMINKFKQISEKMSTDYNNGENQIKSRCSGEYSAPNFYKFNQKNIVNQKTFDFERNSQNSNIQQKKQKHEIHKTCQIQIQPQNVQNKKNDNNNATKRQRYQQHNSIFKQRPIIASTNKCDQIEQKQQFDFETCNKNTKQYKKRVQKNPFYFCPDKQLKQQKKGVYNKLGQHQQVKGHLKCVKSFDSLSTSRNKRNIGINRNSLDQQYYESINLLIPKQKYEVNQHEKVQFSKNKLLKRQNKLSSKNMSKNKILSTYRSEMKEQLKKEIRATRINQSPNQIQNNNIKYASIIDQYDKLKIAFPLFCKYPLKIVTESDLLLVGETMFRTLYNFVVKRQLLKVQKLNDKLHFNIQKTNDYVKYFTRNSLNYHLVYYFKQKIYFGEWIDLQKQGYGLKHGFGYYHNFKKYTYQGQFYYDCKHGKGTIHYSNGDIYNGQWANRKKQGKGLLINSLGEVFKGNFIQGKKNKQGEEYLRNGDYYKGSYYMGKFEGTGIYHWSNGSIYHGQFKNGLLHGKGVWKSKQNDSYEGQYQNNKKHGYGIYKWRNGMIFEGFFKNDERIMTDSKTISLFSNQNTERTMHALRNSTQKIFYKCKSPQNKPKLKKIY